MYYCITKGTKDKKTGNNLKKKNMYKNVPKDIQKKETKNKKKNYN
jgi:hypothetical protein